MGLCFKGCNVAKPGCFRDLVIGPRDVEEAVQQYIDDL
jgi:hypothetical protein